MKYIEQNEIQRRNRATGSQQKMELFEKSGHKEFRNNYKEDRAGVRDELVRRLNIRNLGIPYKIKPEAECITTNPSLSSMHPSSSWYLDWTILVFSLFFYSKIYQVSLILVSLHLLSSMLKVPLSPHLYYLISVHLSGFRLKPLHPRDLPWTPNRNKTSCLFPLMSPTRFVFFNWGVVASHCVGFHCTMKQISYVVVA